jgi:hypothetical protein
MTSLGQKSRGASQLIVAIFADGTEARELICALDYEIIFQK